MHSARAESRRSWASKDEFGAETTSSKSKAGKLRVGYRDEDERQHKVEKMTIVVQTHRHLRVFNNGPEDWKIEFLFWQDVY